MKLLLDSHSLLWAVVQPRRLGSAARKAIAYTENEVAVSSVTFWEIALKHTLGKLDLKGITPQDLPGIAEEHGFVLRPLSGRTAASFHRLPRIDAHRDPFDRMLVWQALEEGRTLVSRDRAMRGYEHLGLELLW